MVNTQIEISGGAGPTSVRDPGAPAPFRCGWLVFLQLHSPALTDFPCLWTHQAGRHSSKARTVGWVKQSGLEVGGNTDGWKTLALSLTDLLDVGSTVGAG